MCDYTESVWSPSDDRLCRNADPHHMELISERFASLIACFSQHPLRKISRITWKYKVLYNFALTQRLSRSIPGASQTLTHSSQARVKEVRILLCLHFTLRFPGTGAGAEFPAPRPLACQIMLPVCSPSVSPGAATCDAVCLGSLA